MHIVEEKLPSLEEALANNDNTALTQLYHISKRVSSLMYREMIKDCHREHGESGGVSYDLIKQHPDFEKYQEWKGLEEKAKTFVSDIPEAQKADVRQKTKETLIKEWHSSYLQSPEKSSLILAYSNRDINDLNRLTRSILKESGHLSNNDFIYTIKKMVEDDFGKKHILQEDQPFSKGDRIVFTRNNYGLGVKNGTMGTIIDLNNQKVEVKLDEGNTISFASKLNPHFNQGWAITIHKSQGTTVDQTYVLASYEITQNLTYVAMTRHREDVKVYGSSLDFWRPDKLPEVLSKSGEKLGPTDYLDGDSLKKLMEREDKILTKIFERVSNELEAMGAVAKKAFWQVANHFLDRTEEKEALIIQSSVREEVRAEQILQEKQQAHTPTEHSISPNQEKISQDLEAIYEEMKHPAYTNATIMKRAFEKGLKAYGEEQAIAYWESKKDDYMNVYQQNLGKVETELNSPVLKNFSQKWKTQAFESAKDNPLKALDFLHQFKEKELVRQEKAVAAAQAEAKKEHIEGLYAKYWNTQEMIKDHPSVHALYHDYLEGLAKEIYLDKSFMKALKISDAKDARDIESLARGKEYQQLQEQEHFRSLDRGRGGLSL